MLHWKLPLHRMALLSPRASAVPELMFSTRRCFTFFSTDTHTHTHTHTRAASSERSTLLHPFKHVTLAQFGSFYRYPEICPASGRPVVYYSGSRLHPADHKHIHTNKPFRNNQSGSCDFYTNALDHSGASETRYYAL